MAGARPTQLLEALMTDVAEVWLSPVVVAEVQRQAKETIEKETSELMSAVKTFGRRYPDQDITALSAAAESLTHGAKRNGRALSLLLEHNACTVVGYPEADVKRLVSRELERRRPTLLKDRQSIGLRDQIIWDGCREILRTPDLPVERLVFVTADGGFLGDTRQLHPDLIAELDADGVEPDRVSVVSSLAEAALEAEVYRKLISSRQLDLAVAAFDFVTNLAGHPWNATLGDIQDARLPDVFLGDATVEHINPTGVGDVSTSNPAHVEIWADLILIGPYEEEVDDHFAIGEWEVVVVDDGRPYHRLKTKLWVGIEVEFDGRGGDLNPRVAAAEFSWDW